MHELRRQLVILFERLFEAEVVKLKRTIKLFGIAVALISNLNNVAFMPAWSLNCVSNAWPNDIYNQ